MARSVQRFFDVPWDRGGRRLVEAVVLSEDFHPVHLHPSLFRPFSLLPAAPSPCAYFRPAGLGTTSTPIVACCSAASTSTCSHCITRGAISMSCSAPRAARKPGCLAWRARLSVVSIPSASSLRCGAQPFVTRIGKKVHKERDDTSLRVRPTCAVHPSAPRFRHFLPRPNLRLLQSRSSASTDLRCQCHAAIDHRLHTFVASKAKSGRGEPARRGLGRRVPTCVLLVVLANQRPCIALLHAR
ncbi:hypothetical protein B0H10DRAFT_709734 [Mycena sp. CBHHK59/15]|nr:hypothetical protein B0H10DRAFT_709734 [Mycena sp. CBHHK59/15]